MDHQVARKLRDIEVLQQERRLADVEIGQTGSDQAIVKPMSA
jgi:hypothetical protein